MSDIVERLRNSEEYTTSDAVPQVAEEAADEIERLQEDAARLGSNAKAWQDRCAEIQVQLIEAQAREAKLREELIKRLDPNPGYAEEVVSRRFPSDDAALRERLAAERDRCAKEFSQWDRDGRWAAGVIRAMKEE